MREFLEITIQDNKVKEFVPFKEDTLSKSKSKYRCEIMF